MTDEDLVEANPIFAGSQWPGEESIESIPNEIAQTCTRRIPVTIVTGFLGSGKTTLLNHIMTTSKRRFAIIENEFSELGIDEKILCENANVIEVLNGCACCNVRETLAEKLDQLYSRNSTFDAMIIETTGLAYPVPVAQTFFVDENIRAKYTLNRIVTVVDAKHIIYQLREEKPVGVHNNEAMEQLCFADCIILNKTDMVNEEELQVVKERLHEINPMVQIVCTEYCKVGRKKMGKMRTFSLSRAIELYPDFLDANVKHSFEHDRAVSSHSYQFEGLSNPTLVAGWISDAVGFPANWYRCKALLNIAGDDRKYIFQGVRRHICGKFSDQKWAKDEKRESRAIFIGKDLDKDFIQQRMVDCQCTEDLRFRVGDKILANVGEWKPGIITKLWDEGNPYKIELEDEEGRCVYAPTDTDTYVCKRISRGRTTSPAMDDLRFKVGDKILANIGYWAQGKIIAVWNEGNPYRIAIDDEERSNVFAPLDTDKYVRDITYQNDDNKDDDVEIENK